MAKSITKTGNWNDVIKQFPQTGILQTSQWSDLKTRYGWSADQKTWQDDAGKIIAAALILMREQEIRPFGIKVKILYVPKGPLLDWNSSIREQVLRDLQEYAHRTGAVYIKIDPEIITARGYPDQSGYMVYESSQEIIRQAVSQGWIISRQQIQFKNTFWIDLSQTEEQLLAGMKQKTRYNIRLAEKKGVIIRKAELSELEKLYSIYAETSQRDGFIIRPKKYYLFLWKSFMSSGMATPLIAEVDQEIVAGLFLFHFAGRSYYMYSMSTNQQREKMPNYLLQWEAIKLSKSLGCHIYDMWGAPDIIEQTDRMWGVYRFKEGLGAELIQTIGALDYPTSKIMYKIIQELLPGILSITRGFRRKQIRSELAE
jgi:peptidoglycan pentaglycine glycine transferase (the first glycine)